MTIQIKTHLSPEEKSYNLPFLFILYDFLPKQSQNPRFPVILYGKILIRKKMKTFKEDLQSFITFLQNNDNPDEIRKEYRRMVKLYHPDIAQENQKQIYNDYILLINKVYSDGKKRAKETVIDTDKKSVNREYNFTKKGADGKIYSYKCRNYYDYLFKIARYEYDTGHAILHFHHLNYLDKKAMDQNSLEVMQHWWNAIKCYKYLLKNCQDAAILDTCHFELEMTQKAVNNLSRTLASSDGKEIMKI